MTMPLGDHDHNKGELEALREEYALWYFTPHKEPTGWVTDVEWAEAHHVTRNTCYNWRRRPEFIAKMEEFRKTYREDADTALQNLIRFSHDTNPRVALPAIKILVDVMGYTTPQVTINSARGMSLMDYLAEVGKAAMHQVTENGGDIPINPIVIDLGNKPPGQMN